MKWILLIALCFVLFCAGCLEQNKSTTNDGGNSADKSSKVPTVTITSPKAGEILQGNRDVSFDAVVSAGQSPISYRWSSNIDGELSTSRKFMQNPSRLSKGGHVIILKVTDGAGTSAQGSVLIEMM
jgi:ABC-type Zn uptake system ZnuABC Zn-binding protein ZnuA